MDFDFPLILVSITAVSGLVWLFDIVALKPGRRRRAAAIDATPGLSDEERNSRRELALRQPVLSEYAQSFFPVLFVILTVRSFIAEPFKIPSGSMMPTVVVGDFILVNKFHYGLRLPVLNSKIWANNDPQRGDVIVFRYPPKPQLNYIKRVVGIAGDEVRYENKTLFVNGVQVPSQYVGPYTGPSEPGGRSMASGQVFDETLASKPHRMMNLSNSASMGDGVWRVPQGHYFVMGDSRDNSEDSRFWGFVPEENLVGEAMVVWMNWSSGIDFGRIGTVIR